MQVVCEATQAQNQHIRVAALECLVKIMSIYYQYMEDYMGAALFAVRNLQLGNYAITFSLLVHTWAKFRRC